MTGDLVDRPPSTEVWKILGSWSDALPSTAGEAVGIAGGGIQGRKLFDRVG